MVAWPKLDTTARRKMSSTAAAGARRLEPRLNAFVTFEDGLPPGDGKLGGLPYAAKDIFRTASHRPTGGFALPTDLAIEGETDLLARLDGAGARRVGFTGLPELAYEPSGYNHARGRVEMVQLTVVSENEGARRLYGALGFVEYGYEKRALKQGGRYYDEVLMVKFLDEGLS